MKILTIGDLHGDFKNVKKVLSKDIDLILLIGDIGKANLGRKYAFQDMNRRRKGMPELTRTSKQKKAVFDEIYYSTLKILKPLAKLAPTYAILGNVGSKMILESEMKKEEKIAGIKLPRLKKALSKIKRFYLVRNKLKKLKKLKIGFLEYFVEDSWVRNFDPTNRDRLKKAIKATKKARKALKSFKKTDILICHQPPYGILDKVTAKFAPKSWQGKHAGSKAILNYIKKYQPKYVFCGHIHEGKGKKKLGQTEIHNLGLGFYHILKCQ
ncbi:MAG: metallophosphoesterase [archaeon]